MRLKEWFSWHFPELTKIVNDNDIFTRLVHKVEHRGNINDDMKDEITAIVIDEEKAQQVIDAAKTSMGTEMNEGDVLQIKRWAERVVDLISYREQLQEYLR